MYTHNKELLIIIICGYKLDADYQKACTKFVLYFGLKRRVQQIDVVNMFCRIVRAYSAAFFLFYRSISDCYFMCIWEINYSEENRKGQCTLSKRFCSVSRIITNYMICALQSVLDYL